MLKKPTSKLRWSTSFYLNISQREVVCVIICITTFSLVISSLVSEHSIGKHYGVVVSMFDFHRSDRGSNPGRGGKIS